MGNFSRDTFDKLKHYVGVRLQQGVPLVDADWNELEDIRKYELEAFIKWFVGNGTPLGNDGFRIVPTRSVNYDYLAALEAPPDLKTELSFIRPILGVGEASKLSYFLLSPSELIHNVSVVNRSPIAAPNFSAKASNSLAINALRYLDNITNSHPQLLIVPENDFCIVGGDGTADGAGRCLVEGWDVMIENSLLYSEQPLFKNDALAEKWKVPSLQPLNTPRIASTDTVYLDVWEHEETAEDDPNLISTKIGVETCVRRKREWVVRVALGISSEGFRDFEVAEKEKFRGQLAGHVFYPIALLERKKNVAMIDNQQIKDLRDHVSDLTDLTAKFRDHESDITNLTSKLQDHESDIANLTSKLQDHNHSGNEQGNPLGSAGLGDNSVTFSKIKFSPVCEGTTQVLTASVNQISVMTGIDDEMIKSKPYFPVVMLKSMNEDKPTQVRGQIWVEKTGETNSNDIYLSIFIEGNIRGVVVNWWIYSFDE